VANPHRIRVLGPPFLHVVTRKGEGTLVNMRFVKPSTRIS